MQVERALPGSPFVTSVRRAEPMTIVTTTETQSAKGHIVPLSLARTVIPWLAFGPWINQVHSCTFLKSGEEYHHCERMSYSAGAMEYPAATLCLHRGWHLSAMSRCFCGAIKGTEGFSMQQRSLTIADCHFVDHADDMLCGLGQEAIIVHSARESAKESDEQHDLCHLFRSA